MLRVELRHSIFTLEGRLTAADAEHIQSLIMRADVPANTLMVDLTEVTFVDSVGETVLSFLGRLGAEFVAETAYSLDVCERLGLRLARSVSSEGDQADRSKRPSQPHDA